MKAEPRRRKSLRIAVAQYPVGCFHNWDEFTAKIEDWFHRAKHDKARLLVFPEYAAMELASLLKPGSRRSGVKSHLRGIQTFLPDYLRTYYELCARHRVWALTGSFPVRLESGEYRNRAWLVGPAGAAGYQDKIILTPWEKAVWGIRSGGRPLLFETELGRIGICICYDVEFPRIARAMAEAGVEVILAPSCTDTLAGYHRVRVGAQARALENQCFVVQAPLVGNAPWSPAVDVNIGAAGVFSPPDTGFPDDGVLALGEMSAPRWVVADMNLSRLSSVRRRGQVRTFRDWATQPDIGAEVVELKVDE